MIPSYISGQDSLATLDCTSNAIGFGLGIVASALVGIPIYYIQRRADEVQARKATMEMYSLWREGQLRDEVINGIDQKIDTLLAGKSLESQLSIILVEYEKVNASLGKSFRQRDSSRYIEEAVEYKALADAWADRQIVTGTFEVLDSEGQISLERILKTHKKIFPNGYAWAGRFRNHILTIVGQFGAGSRTINPMLSSMETAVLPPEQINDKLSALIDRWNASLGFIGNDQREAKVAELASFHQEFLLIHPFTDGNGRISRVILNEQASFLFQKSIRVQFQREEYHQALHLADLKEPKSLQCLISDAVG